MYEPVGVPDGSDWVTTLEPLVDVTGLVGNEDEFPLLDRKLSGLEVGMEDEYGGRGNDLKEVGEGGEEGNDNDGPGDGAKYDG